MPSKRLKKEKNATTIAAPPIVFDSELKIHFNIKL